MTGAQKDYLQRAGIDPWTLEWRDARDSGLIEWGASEAALLPDGRILLANGQAVSNQEHSPTSEPKP